MRVHGAKWQLGPWVIAHLPELPGYVEPFAGGGAVLLRRRRVPHEALSDADPLVINHLITVRDRPDALACVVEATPFAKPQIDHACRLLARPEPGEVEAMLATDAGRLELARLVAVASYQSRHGYPPSRLMGLRRDAAGQNARTWAGLPARYPALAARLRGVTIVCRDALDAIAVYDGPGTTLYVDPPYVASTRGPDWAKRGYHRNELDEAGHIALARALLACRGAVVLSGYRSALYTGLFESRGWERVEHNGVRTNGAVRRTECLWLNPAARAALAMGRR